MIKPLNPPNAGGEFVARNPDMERLPHADIEFLRKFDLVGLTETQVRVLAYLLASFVAFRFRLSENFARSAFMLAGWTQTAVIAERHDRKALPFLPLPKSAGGVVLLRAIVSFLQAPSEEQRNECLASVLNRFYLLVDQQSNLLSRLDQDAEAEKAKLMRATLLLRDYVKKEDTSVEAFSDDLTAILEGSGTRS